MKFADKLNGLISIVNVTNSKIAKTLNVDPSLVSRWRTGARMPSSHSTLIERAGAFFAEQITAGYQKEALYAFTKNEKSRSDRREEVEESITRWLRENEEMPHVLMDNAPEKEGMRSHGMKCAEIGLSAGKGMINALFAALDAMQPRKRAVYIYSNATLDTINQIDRVILQQFAKHPDLQKIFSHIHLILSADLSSDEIAAKFDYILPVLRRNAMSIHSLSGYRNNPFGDFLLIIEDLGAFAISAFADTPPVCSLQTEKNAVRKFQSHFTKLLKESPALFTRAQTRPLEKAFEESVQFLAIQDNLLTAGNMLPPVCIPVEPYYALMRRCHGERFEKAYYRQKLEKSYIQFLSLLEHHDFFAALPLYSPEEVEKGAVVTPGMPRFLDGKPTIDPSLYLAALRRMDYFLQKCQHFSFQHTRRLSCDYHIIIRPQHALFFALDEPEISAYIAPRPVTAQLVYDYIMRKHRALPEQMRGRETNRKRLQEHIGLFEAYLD